MKILIADDNPMNLKLLKAILEGEGHEIVEALDGLEALSFLEDGDFDAVISDILMPRKDGYRLCQDVRSDPRWKNLPFVIYTSTYTSPADEELARRVGADVYLRKPAPAKHLLETLAAVCNAAPVTRTIAPAFGDDEGVLKEYSEALVRKLTEKNIELERAKAEVMRANLVLEERVLARTAELEAANEELEAFSHSAAHDLRAPLRAIGAYSQLLLGDKESQLSEDGKTALLRIEASVSRINDLIGQLLELSRIRHAHLSFEHVSVSDQIASIVDDLRWFYPDNKVDVAIEAGMQATGDSSLLRTAFENILRNAWKFSKDVEHPKVQVSSEVRERTVIFCVADNGVGFDMKGVDRLFQPFERLHSQREFEGTGLGLTIVNRVIRRHGGYVKLESELGKGTSAFIALPILRDENKSNA